MIAAAGAGVLAADYLRPRALFEPPTRFTAGAINAFALGSVLLNEAHSVYVMRLQEGFRALSAVCTHLGCITRYRPDERIIACPCHGSRFALDGEVLAGPAPRSLPLFEMDVSSRGEVMIDTAVEVPPGTVFKL
ncbi:MAG: Rieske 2Fe-2S domain-containing protein [Acidobacteria bacterium]|nr:Rieske 2Fe-2S domain-containing protein [Acidobacteriota bacterium]NIQ30655.1 Rieske 2Fe-2S domain-containing protein [Acidobacteriota bacterium]NIQ85613.1 Rieske 2Fe-2S domain-containing protein [Acidobacteriota bacterium]